MARPDGDRHGTRRRLIAGSTALVAASLAMGCGEDRNRSAQAYPGPALARVDMALDASAPRGATSPKRLATPAPAPRAAAQRPATSSTVLPELAAQTSLPPVNRMEPALRPGTLSAVSMAVPVPVTSVADPAPPVVATAAPGIVEAGNARARVAEIAGSEASPAIAALPDAAPSLAAIAASGTSDSPAFVSQVSDSVRAAYIAQVDAAVPDQRLAVRSADRTLGAVQFQVTGNQMSVHIGQVLELFAADIEPARFAHLRQSAAANEFVTLDQIRSAGIPLDYNPAYDELVLGPDRG